MFGFWSSQFSMFVCKRRFLLAVHEIRLNLVSFLFSIFYCNIRLGSVSFPPSQFISDWVWEKCMYSILPSLLVCDCECVKFSPFPVYVQLIVVLILLPIWLICHLSVFVSAWYKFYPRFLFISVGGRGKQGGGASGEGGQWAAARGQTHGRGSVSGARPNYTDPYCGQYPLGLPATPQEGKGVGTG